MFFLFRAANRKRKKLCRRFSSGKEFTFLEA
jgi:hypothetical protein